MWYRDKAEANYSTRLKLDHDVKKAIFEAKTTKHRE